MSIVGRLVPIPRGEYNAKETYKMQDFVYYLGSSYVAKKTVTGITPEENSEYWQLYAAGADAGTVAVTDTEGLVVEKGQNTALQTFLDEVADRIVNKLVTDDALTAKLANYVAKSMMSGVDIDDSSRVPNSAFIHALKETIDQNKADIATLNSEIRFQNNPSDWDNIISSDTSHEIVVSAISNSTLPPGAPQNAYQWGVLLTICSANWAKWAIIQIYIPHGKDHIFVRSIGDSNGWRKITGEIVEYTQE